MVLEFGLVQLAFDVRDGRLEDLSCLVAHRPLIVLVDDGERPQGVRSANVYK
jgi:hypothetical protein